MNAPTTLSNISGTVEPTGTPITYFGDPRIDDMGCAGNIDTGYYSETRYKATSFHTGESADFATVDAALFWRIDNRVRARMKARQMTHEQAIAL
jgi:hypothetical protein